MVSSLKVLKIVYQLWILDRHLEPFVKFSGLSSCKSSRKLDAEGQEGVVGLMTRTLRLCEIPSRWLFAFSFSLLCARACDLLTTTTVSISTPIHPATPFFLFISFFIANYQPTSGRRFFTILSFRPANDLRLYSSTLISNRWVNLLESCFHCSSGFG